MEYHFYLPNHVQHQIIQGNFLETVWAGEFEPFVAPVLSKVAVHRVVLGKVKWKIFNFFEEICSTLRNWSEAYTVQFTDWSETQHDDGCPDVCWSDCGRKHRGRRWSEEKSELLSAEKSDTCFSVKLNQETAKSNIPPSHLPPHTHALAKRFPSHLRMTRARGEENSCNWIFVLRFDRKKMKNT